MILDAPARTDEIGTPELVRAAAAGDSLAQAQLIRRYGNVVRGTVRRFRLPDADVQDAVQNTWVQMIEHLGDLRDADRLPGWLVTTARRECLKILRQSRRCVAGGGPDMPELVDEKSPRPESSAVDAAMADLLWRHVAKLPPRGRQILGALVVSGGAGYAEFAEATGIPVGSLGPLRMRYLARLRRGLEDAGLDAHAWH